MLIAMGHFAPGLIHALNRMRR